MAYCNCGEPSQPDRCCMPAPPPVPCCLQGPAGVTGPAGATGPTGATGATGAAGVVTPAAAVAEASSVDNIVEQFNLLLRNMREAGLLES